MLVLAVDSSAVAASAAITDNGRLLGEYYINTKQTHSQTLLPMVQGLLSSVGKTCKQLDLLAVSCGPGSFTGVRIGISCVKGLSLPYDIPCCEVSTLEVIAHGAVGCEGSVICAVMDARCNQVYNAMFRVESGKIHRLCEDRALSVDDLKEECKEHGASLVLVGDGACLCYEHFKDFGACLAPEAIRFQHASSLALIAEEKALNGRTVSASELLPTYLRMPQAERELKKKKGEI